MGVRTLDFTGISGHALMSTARLTVAIFVALLPARGAMPGAGVVAGLLLGVLVGVSRVGIRIRSEVG